MEMLLSKINDRQYIDRKLIINMSSSKQSWPVQERYLVIIGAELVIKQRVEIKFKVDIVENVLK